MYSHAFGGPLDSLTSALKRTGSSVADTALDSLGAPKISQNFADNYQSIQRNLNKMSKGMSNIQKINFSQFQNTLGTVRNTLKSDLQSSVAKGITTGVGQVEEDFITKYKPYLIGGGVLLAAVVGYMVLKK